MLPAREHFEAVKPPGGEIDLLFEIGDDLLARDRGAQPGFQLVPRVQFALHRGVEPGIAVPSSLLGGVHRDVGAAQQRSEEHTSELQSLMRISYAVFCFQKKNKYTH